MIIVVASTSKVKLDAVHEAMRDNGMQATVVGVKAASGINEQPLNEETLQGAKNRSAHARELNPNADLYISIENGIFGEEDQYYDKAVVLAVAKDGRERIQYSQPVQFPTAMVDLARARGFQATTVGSVMQENGIVKDNADPHLDLIGKSRAEILKETVSSLFQAMELAQQPELQSRVSGQPRSADPRFE